MFLLWQVVGGANNSSKGEQVWLEEKRLVEWLVSYRGQINTRITAVRR